MNFRQLIDKLISEPGHFIVFESNKDSSSSAQKTKQRFLNIFKEQETAKRVFAVYAASHKNADSLLKEAEVLSENGYYARAVALAIMSFEELGKSQIAADYHSGILSEDEYKRAFRSHKKTSFASRYATIGAGEQNVKYGFWIDDSIAKKFEEVRQMAIYVDENNDPIKVFSRQDAEYIITKVRRHIEYINYAEEFNGRIGSKALFK
jgi:AbiV family abortive infection protein